jgi:cysteine desulfurase
MKTKIYLDNAATTKIDEKVVKEMLPYLEEKFGNASSQHSVGHEAKNAMERSRKIIAKAINAKPDEIIFNSGGTEGNNTILKGLWFQNQKDKTGKNHFITTKVEHDCILNVCKWLETQGAQITYLDVNKQGFIDLKQLKESIKPETIIVSVIHGNNEVGTIQDLEAIGEICKEKQVLSHSDACQSFTKVKLDVKKQNLDFLTLNSHKIHGPKGIGAIYKKSGIKIIPLFHGGGHEHKQRSGTENIPGIVGFGKAIDVAKSKDFDKIQKLQEKLIKGVLEIPKVTLNGPEPGKNRLQNNANFSFNDIEGEAIGGYLENEGILSSTGSACMSNTLETSHVLKAMGLSALESNSSIRMTLSKYTTEEEIDYVLKKLPGIVKKLRRFSPLVN